MRQLIGVAVAGVILALGTLHAAVHAADEDSTSRVREMLHRTQEALRQAQSSNADLASQKDALEQKLKTAATQLDAAQSGSKAAQAALSGKLSSSQSAQADLTKKLAEAADKLAAATGQLNDAAKQLAARDAELAQLKQGLTQSTAANASCESKNVLLYTYSQEVLQAYRNKGVWASLSQKDPVLGLKQVDVENVVQEYRLKFASQKIKP
jgi:chromosome segregation ATPase